MVEAMLSVKRKDKEGMSSGFLEPGVWLCAVFNQIKLEEGTSFMFRSYFQVTSNYHTPPLHLHGAEFFIPTVAFLKLSRCPSGAFSLPSRSLFQFCCMISTSPTTAFHHSASEVHNSTPPDKQGLGVVPSLQGHFSLEASTPAS